MQAKDRELAEAQQQLREKVNGVKCVHHVWCVTIYRGPPDAGRTAEVAERFTTSGDKGQLWLTLCYLDVIIVSSDFYCILHS